MRLKIWIMNIISFILLLMPTVTITAQQQYEYTLLLGLDTGIEERVEDLGRPDVIILVAYDSAENSTRVVSIPRDTYIEIPDYGMDKLNHAYTYGRETLIQETLNQWLDIKIDHYAVVDMSGLVEVIDMIGGVTLIPHATFTFDGYHFDEGIEQHLDGEQALAYVREREVDSDYGRQERQRQLIEAMFQKGIDFDSFSQATEAFTIFKKYVQTDYNLWQMWSLYGEIIDRPIELKFQQLSGEGEIIDEIYYEIINEDELQQLKQELAGIE